jgi:beta-fructofuranosidase
VLLYSTAGKVAWEVGELDPKELLFHPQRNGVLDHGAYYAQKTQLDAKANRVLWGWIPERRPEAEHSAAGWAGCMALPRVLSLSAQSDLEMRIAPPAEMLRGRPFPSLSSNAPGEVRRKSVASIEIKDVAGELAWQASSGAFSMTITDTAGPWWWLNLDVSGSAMALQVCAKKIDLPSLALSELKFHLVLDASVAEFFCNSLHVVTSRIYRKPAGPLRVQISEDSLSRLQSLQAWQLRPISKNRLTT